MFGIFAFFFLSPKIVFSQSGGLTFVTRVLSDAIDVDLQGDYVFTSHSGGIAFHNIVDPENPFLTTNYQPDACRYGYLDISGNILFSTQSSDLRYDCSRRGIHMYNSLHLIDITNKSSPFELGFVSIGGPGGGTETDQSGAYNFFTNSHGGLVVIDTTNPASPEVVETFSFGAAVFNDINVVGQRGYLADLNGKFWIVDVSDPNNIETISNNLSIPNALRVDVQGDFAYVAAGGHGLYIIDVSNEASPSVVGNIDWRHEVPTDNDTLDVDVEGNFAFLSNSYRGVVVVDISDPTSPFEVARLDLDGYARKLKYRDGYVFVADIFKGLNILKFENGESSNILDVPLFKQNDPAWGSQTYDSAGTNPLSCGSTIGQCGCVVSSIAMILKYHGVDRDPDGNPTTPETVNNYFKSGQVCDNFGCSSLGYSYGNVLWGAGGLYSEASNKAFDTQKVVFKGKLGFDMDEISSLIDSQQPVAMRVIGKEHWVVATGVAGSTLAINDPGFDRIRLNDIAYGNTALASRLYEKTASDFSSFQVTSKAPTQILVTDNQGRSTGYDILTNGIVEEIPNSYYEFEGAYSDPTGVNPPPLPGDGVYTVVILTPEQDKYQVQVVGENGDDYGFTVHASDRNANLDFNLFSNEMPPSGFENYVFNYNPDPAVEEKFSQEIKIDIWPFIKTNIIFRKLKLPIPVGILSSPTFNAPEDLNKKSLTFGKTGEEESLVQCFNFYPDLNRDGMKDVYCLFSAQKSEFQVGDRKGILKGITVNGLELLGEDFVAVH